MVLIHAFAAFTALAVCAVQGFVPGYVTPPNHDSVTNAVSSKVTLQMGLFDALGKAFSNEEYAAPPEGIKASARHILVKDPNQIDIVMEKLRDGEAFANVAREFSTCPSGSSGGSLGSFGPGTMVKEFDEVIFNKDTNIGEIVGPVQTKVCEREE